MAQRPQSSFTTDHMWAVLVGKCMRTDVSKVPQAGLLDVLHISSHLHTVNNQKNNFKCNHPFQLIILYIY